MSIWLHTTSRKRLRDGNRGVPQLHLGVTALGAWLAQRTPLHDHNLKVTAVQGKLSGSFSGM